MRNSIFRALLSISVISVLTVATSVCGAETEKKSDFYKVKVSAKADRATIVVTGRGGYHCNIEYPWKLTVESMGTTSILKKGDAETFKTESVVFVAPYKKSAKAVLKMSMCDDKQCKMEKIPLAW